MHPAIIIGTVIVPQRTECSVLPSACRIVGIRGNDVCVIPIVWDEKKTDPPAPFVVDADDLRVELQQQVSTSARAATKSFDRHEPVPKKRKKAPEVDAKPNAADRAKEIRTAFEPLIDSKEKLQRVLFDATYRAQCLREVAGMSEFSARRYFHKYLIYNFEDKAFSPYTRSDATRNPKQRSGAKRGRSKGGPALPEVRDNLTLGIHKYYIGKNHTEKQSFVDTLLEFYPRACASRLTDEGKTEHYIREEFRLKVPSASQFQYLIRLIAETTGIKRVRSNARRKEREAKANKGSARDYVDLAGAVFQADATKLQVRVVAPWNRQQVLGSVTLYLAVDVATTAICGWFLSHEAPSTALALRLLKQCGSSKEQDLARVGWPYVQAEWVEAIPASLHADRGEWVSKKAETITRGGVCVKVGKPYTPHKKGAIEQTHNLVKRRLIEEGIPGIYSREHQRGEGDGIADAALTLLEIEQRVVKIILDINRRPSPADLPAEMVAEQPRDVSRIALWKWRTQRELGQCRELSPKQMFEAFLQPTEASITAKGLLLDGRDYRSDVLDTFGLTLKAANKRGQKMPVFIDEQLPAYVFFKHPKTQQLEPARYREPGMEKYKLDLWGLNAYLAHIEQLKNDTEFSALVHSNKGTQAQAPGEANAKALTKQAIAEQGKPLSARGKGRAAASTAAAVVANVDYELGLAASGVLPAPVALPSGSEAPASAPEADAPSVAAPPPANDAALPPPVRSFNSKFAFKRTSA